MAFGMTIFMELSDNNGIIFHLPSTSSHLQPLQVENCDSNSRLVVDEDDNGKFRIERVEYQHFQMNRHKLNNESNFHPIEVVGGGSKITSSGCKFKLDKLQRVQG